MKFDLIVITAANAPQAKGYEAQVKSLQGKLTPRIIVVPDPCGRRVGSLGSTVHVFKKIGGLRNRRILICHSGGDSKRLPAYAAIGKAFVPVPQQDGSRISLFEVIVRNMEKLALPKNGALVVCGDVAPDFDFASCDFSAKGVTGVAYEDSYKEARRHGVYVANGKSKLRLVNEFLQKPDVHRGRFLIDTGILWIDGKTAAHMTRKGWKEGDIYAEFTRELVNGFSSFHVNVVPKCTFFHVGSSRELLKLLGHGKEWIDACYLPRSEMKLGGQNIVTFVPREYGKIILKKKECLTCLPLDGKWMPLRYRVDDDFKADGTWEKLKLSEKMKRIEHKKLVALRGAPSILRSAVSGFAAEEIKVALPLRIDLAGGWSDTPPICNELGGCVFNMAVLLEGVKPVQVVIRRLAETEVRVDSADLGKSCVLKTLKEIRAPKDPHDWCALVKSALTVTNFDFNKGGLDIRISADVPKGSGLGTSSVLGAAVVTALQRIAGKRDDWKAVSELTLQLEREMRTGGGWQDQVGGLLPGAKLIESARGKKQQLKIRKLSSAAEKRFAAFLKERALLYFTGRKRMARNILRGVLNFYKENPDDIAHEIIRRLKADAKRAYVAAERGEWSALASAINDYWLSKKALDPGSTNPLVELIIARMAPWISAVSLCGAGGGGFMFVIARSKEAKAKMKSALEKHPPIRSGRFYDFEIC